MQPPGFMAKKLESGLHHLEYQLEQCVWIPFRGEVQFVEATSMAGKGDLHLTGQLGDVIKESAQIALTWVNMLCFLCLVKHKLNLS